MIPLRFEFGKPGACFDVRCMVAREFGAYSIRLDGLKFDSRFIPTMFGATIRWRMIAFPSQGEVSVGGLVSGGDRIVVATDKVIAPGPTADTPLLTVGSNVHLACIRLRPDDFADSDGVVARSHEVSAATRDALRSLASSVDDQSQEGVKRRVEEALKSLAADGIIKDTSAVQREGERAPKGIAGRVAAAIYPLLSKLANRPMMIDLVARAGVSERQLLRDILKIQREFDLLDRGWRNSIVRWRTTAGVLLLSSPSLSLDEVATLAGYSSTSAMSRAFREAKLPPPSAIRSVTRDGLPWNPASAGVFDHAPN